MRLRFVRPVLVALIALTLALVAEAQNAPMAGQTPYTKVGDLTLAAAAGYKRPVMDLIAAFEKQGSGSVHGSFGNLQQIVALAQASPEVALVIGDKAFLEKVPLFDSFAPIGPGKMVLAWPRGHAAIETAADLQAPGVRRIALPDAKDAVYGVAAMQWLGAQGLADGLVSRLIHVKTVPQVSAYLISGEVDAGFINLTDALAIRDQIGGYRVLTTGYAPIEIVAATVHGRAGDPAVAAFLAFLETPAAQATVARYGL